MYWCRIIDLFVVRTTILWRSANEKDKKNVDIYEPEQKPWFLLKVLIGCKMLYLHFIHFFSQKRKVLVSLYRSFLL